MDNDLLTCSTVDMRVREGGGGGGKGQKRVKKTSVVYNITLMMIGENATSEKK